MRIGLFFDNRGHGPGKVVNNLIRGLTDLKHEIIVNSLSEFNGNLNQIRSDLPFNTLMGPNLIVLPNENPALFQSYKNFVIPSNWVYDKYKSFNCTWNNIFHIWSVGIDTDKFNESNKTIEQDCFVYFKNRSIEDLLNLEIFLKKHSIKYSILKYGEYPEERLIEQTKKSRFCILLTKTESQGIAYMEILSSNVPCLVINKNIWNDYGGYSFPSTSVPYFDNRCGIISDGFNGFEEKLNSIIANIEMYKPREYILENHTLKISANKYVEILRKTI